MKKKLLLFIMLVTAFAPAAAQTAPEDLCFQRGATWHDETGQCRFHTGIEIDINYPLSLVEHDFAQQIIDQFLSDYTFEFWNFYAGMEIMPSLSFPWTLMIDYEEFQFSPDIVSINFIIYTYTGGAHGNTFFQTFTFDLANERELKFRDLFQEEHNPLWLIAPIVQKDLKAQLGDFANTDWIQDGSGENLENYRNFAITEDALLLFFEPYQIAPYAAGPQTVRITLDDINVILRPPFLELE